MSVAIHGAVSEKVALSCLDVYGPRPIATDFGKLWSKGHNC